MRRAKMLWLLVLMMFFRIRCGSTVGLEHLSMGERQQQVVDAILSAGDFGNWANILYNMDSSRLPFSATFFVPTDEALATLSGDIPAALVQYHIVPQRLGFSDLRTSPVGQRFHTLLANCSIVLTGYSRSNLTVWLDEIPVTHPDIFYDGTFAVHGVSGVLDYGRFGNGSAASGGESASFPLVSPPVGSPSESEISPSIDYGDVEARTPLPERGNSSSSELEPRKSKPSDAPCLCREFPFAFTAVSVAFVLRFLRFPLR